MSNKHEKSGPVSRRSFLRRGGAIAGGAAAGSLLAAPAVMGQSPMVLKMQTSWPASDIWQTMAQQYVDRVEAMSGGRIKIDLLPAGAVVGAFQVMDGVSDGVIDIAHSVSAYWYGKNKAASLFGTGPVFGGDPTNMLAWFYQGGGRELYRELTQDQMGLNVVGLMAFPMPAQPFGWFKDPIGGVDDIKGMKYRTVGLAADLLQSMGMSVAQLPGGAPVGGIGRAPPDDHALGHRVLRLVILGVHADIADMGEGEGHNLPGIGGIRHDLLVAGHRRVEAQFRLGHAGCAEAGAVEQGSVGQREAGGRFLAMCEGHRRGPFRGANRCDTYASRPLRSRPGRDRMLHCGGTRRPCHERPVRV